MWSAAPICTCVSMSEVRSVVTLTRIHFPARTHHGPRASVPRKVQPVWDIVFERNGHNDILKVTRDVFVQIKLSNITSTTTVYGYCVTTIRPYLLAVEGGFIEFNGLLNITINNQFNFDYERRFVLYAGSFYVW